MKTEKRGVAEGGFFLLFLSLKKIKKIMMLLAINMNVFSVKFISICTETCSIAHLTCGRVEVDPCQLLVFCFVLPQKIYFKICLVH